MVDYPKDPTYRHDLARGCFNLGQLHLELNDLDQSLAVFRQAADLYGQLVEQRPSSLDFAREQAVALRLIGDVETRRQQLPEARTAYEQALEKSERLARQNPLVAELKHDLSRLYISLGRWHRMLGDPEPGIRYCDQAIVLLTTLIADDPSVDLYSIDLAAAHAQRGQLHEMNADLEQACAALAEAVRLYQELAQKGTATADEEFASAAMALGAAQMARGDMTAAIEAFSQAETQAKAHAEKLPADIPRQLLLAKARAQLGFALGRNEQTEQSLQKMQAAVDALEALRVQHPAQPVIERELSDTFALRAEVMFDWGRLGDAAVQLKRAIDLRAARGKAPDATPRDMLAWAEASQGLALILMEQGEQSSALAALEESTGVFEQAHRRFLKDPQVRSALAGHYVYRLSLERRAKRFGEIPLLAEKAGKMIADQILLLELVRELSLAAGAAQTDPDDGLLVRIHERAIEATKKAMPLSAESLRMLRENPDFEALREVSAWQALLDGSS
jgi:tetratricopeptide (TPR) repeat protein